MHSKNILVVDDEYKIVDVTKAFWKNRAILFLALPMELML